MSTRRKPPSRSPRAVSTGIKVEAVARHHASIPAPPPGEHLWCMFGMWRLSDGSARAMTSDEHGTVHLDYENLMTIEGPGCYWCEQPYSLEVAIQPCPWRPEGNS